MKLVLVSHYMPPHHGGIERVVEDHAKTAAGAGWQVIWFASNAPVQTSGEQVTTWGRTHRVRCWNFLEDRFGVPYPIWLPGAGSPLRRAVADADLVHVHDLLYPGSSIALAEASRRGKPTLLTQHVGFVPYRSRLLEMIEHGAYRTIGRRNAARATRWAYVSETGGSWLKEIANVARPATHLANGVDTDLFRPLRDESERRELREKHRIPQDRVVVLFVGRFVHKKGAHLLAEAAPESAHLLFIGERGDAPVVSRSGIEVRAFAPREELAEIFRAVDIFALPSRGEGFPIVAQEAMASGLPVVLGDEPAYRRELDDGSAVLVEAEVTSLQCALEELIGDADRRQQIGARAVASARRHWEQNTCRQRLLALYEELASA